MEQFLSTYFSQKYGLKSIVAEQVKAVVAGVQAYSHLDHEVLLLGKVLRHEVDEEFRYVQLTVKSTIMQLLKTFMRQRLQMKSQPLQQRKINDVVQGA